MNSYKIKKFSTYVDFLIKIVYNIIQDAKKYKKERDNNLKIKVRKMKPK